MPRSFKPLPNQYLSTSPTRDQATINYLTSNLPNPFNGIPQFAGTNLSGSVVARTAVIAPYPQFSGISYYTYDGKSWYDALSVTLEKRFSHGYSVLASYTRSRYMERVFKLNNTDANYENRLSGNDVPNREACLLRRTSGKNPGDD